MTEKNNEMSNNGTPKSVKKTDPAQQKNQLHTQLWNIANELRGNMRAENFKEYVLSFIFYKYLSQKIELLANKLLEPDGLTFAKIKDRPEFIEAIRERCISELGYFLEPKEMFSYMAQNADDNKTLNTDLVDIFKHIERSTLGKESEDDFDSLFSEIDLNSQKIGKSLEEKNRLLAKVLQHLDKIDFQLEDSEIDVLGDAYEYLIGQFAAGAGQKGGEFYTPQEVSEVLARIVKGDRLSIRNVYDPTCGSASLLIRIGKVFGKNADKIEYFGQESEPETYNLARMNMILHDINYKRFDIVNGDTLENPGHLEKRFDAICANPPFSLQWSAATKFLEDERFLGAGKLPPKSKADWAFVEHMIYQLADGGTLACVVPHGVLFRGSAEKNIREFFIESKDYLDAVIGLPSNVFFGTGIPVAIVVFKKNRENHENVLFIDASREFEKKKNQNVLLPAHIDKIVDTFNERKEIEKYSHLASLEEIKENDYNLNISRYVDTFEPEPEVDIEEVYKEFKALDTQIAKTEKSIDEYLKMLGVGV